MRVDTEIGKNPIMRWKVYTTALLVELRREFHSTSDDPHANKSFKQTRMKGCAKRI